MVQKKNPPLPRFFNHGAPALVRQRGFFFDMIARFFFFQWLIIKTLFLAALVFSLVAAGAFYLAQQNFERAEVDVPNIAGLNVEKAMELLHREGQKLTQGKELALKIEGMEFSDLASEGEIIGQFPRSGSRVKAGSIIRVRVSKGSTEVPCPDMRGLNHQDAWIQLRKVDLEQGLRTDFYDAEVSKGLVLSQDPAPGTLLSRGAKVNLLVSSGPETPKVLMPRLEGLPVPEAEARLAVLGLRISTAHDEPSLGRASGTILRHDPKAGMPVAANTAISVTIVRNLDME